MPAISSCGTQKRCSKEYKQLDIPEEVHEDLVWWNVEQFPATPFPQGPGPKLLNFLSGVSYAFCQTEVHGAESQRQFRGHVQFRNMEFRPVMCELKFCRAQVAVDLLARSHQLGYETEFGLTADACLQPKLLHLQQQ